MLGDLDAMRDRARQLIAFADGYEEAATIIVASVTGMSADVARGAPRMRTVAYDLLRLADAVEAYRIAAGPGTQGSFDEL